MKTTRIDIEGRLGKATIFRSGGEIVINASKHRGSPDKIIRRGISPTEDSWVVGCRDFAGQQGLAARLQQTLDGDRGTVGDVADYLRAIETFAD